MFCTGGKIGLGIGIAVFLSSCAGGGGSSAGTASPGAASDSGEAGGVSAGANLAGHWTASGPAIARLELTIPQGDVADGNRFLLRGTIPVPKGIFPPAAPTDWFGVMDHDGSVDPVPAQIDVVTRYATGEPSILEIVAPVHRGDAEAASTQSLYDIVPIVFDSGAPTKTGPVLNLPHEIATLGDQPREVFVAATDPFGNLYLASPFGTQNETILSDGPYRNVMRSYTRLIPAPPVSGANGTLPHLLGVHAYVGRYTAEKAMTLDLRIHNGMIGPNSGQQEVIGKAYFGKIELVIPNGYTVRQDFEDPSFDLAGVHPIQINGKNYQAIPLVKALPNNEMHVMPELGQFHRRLAITPTGNDARARAVLDQEGLGFASAGLASSGGELYSWWNKQTSNFMQGDALPDLGFWGPATVRTKLLQNFNADKMRLLTGTPGGEFLSSTLGWAFPCGFGYGGATGGGGIDRHVGIEQAYAASAAGILHTMLLHRTNIERQPNAMYFHDGTPVSLAKLKKQGANGYSAVADFFLVPNGTNAQKYFKLNSAPTAHESYVASQGLAPSYENKLLSYKPHDLQHYIRLTRYIKTLAYLANDALAKDDGVLQANLARLSNHELAAGSGTSAGKLFAMSNAVAAHPGKGVHFGRGEAWSLDMVYCAYAYTQDDALRADLKVWADTVADVISQAQVPCSGIVFAGVNDKWLGGLFRTCQRFEQAIVDTAIRGCLFNIYEGTGEPRESSLRNALIQACYGMVQAPSFKPNSGPFSYQAVGPLDITQSLFCSSPLPPGADSGTGEKFQSPSTYGYGWHLTGDPIFLQKAAEAFGGPGALKAVLEQTNWTTNNLGNNASLLRAWQDNNGQIP